MALQISALFSYVRVPLYTGPLSRVRANFQGAGIKFKHILTPGTLGGKLGVKPATSPLHGHINVDVRAAKFSTTTTAAAWKSTQGNSSSSPRGRRGWLSKVALGAALGVSTVALVQSLHTGTLTAMALKVNLNSAEGEWKETKGERVQPSPRGCSFHFKTATLQRALSVNERDVCCHMTKTPVQVSATVRPCKHVRPDRVKSVILSSAKSKWS